MLIDAVLLSTVDHPGLGKLHEQQQTRECLWFQVAKSRSGEFCCNIYELSLYITPRLSRLLMSAGFSATGH